MRNWPSRSLPHLLACLTVGAGLYAQVVKLHPEMPPLAGKVRGDFQVTSDGARVVFYSDQQDPRNGRLFSVTSDGSALPVQLSDYNLQAREDFALTLDGTRVVHAKDFGLWITPIVGGPAQRLGEEIEAFSIEHLTNERVVFTNSFSLRSVRLDNTEQTKPLYQRFGHTIPRAQGVSSGARVLFSVAVGLDTFLRSVPIDGSAASVLVAPLPVFPDWVAHPAGTRALYWEFVASGESHLASNLVTGGGTPIRLTRGPSAGSTTRKLALAPNGVAVAFEARSSAGVGSALFGAQVDGALDPIPLCAAGAFDATEGLRFGPGSRTLWFLGTQNGLTDVYRVPVDGRAAPERVTPATAGRPVTDFVVSPDGTRIAYLQPELAGGGAELWSVPAIHGAPVRLSPDLAPGEGVLQVSFSESSQTVAFGIHGPDPIRPFRLYSAPRDGSSPAVRLFPGQLVANYRLRGSTIFATGEDVERGLQRLYAAPLDGTGTTTLLSPDYQLEPPISDITSFQALPDGSRAVYVGDPEYPEERFLYTATLEPTPVWQRLSSESPVQSFQLTADGQLALFYVGIAGTPLETHVVPTNGSLPSQRLNLGTGYIYSRLLTPDGTRIIYESDEGGSRRDWVTRLDNSVPPWLLPGVPADRSDEVVTPDSRRLVFSAGIEVYSQELDGTTPAVSLGMGPVRTGSYLWQLRLSPDGSRVVVTNDPDGDDDFDLFSRPTDGSGQTARIAFPSLPGAKIRDDFRITPDGLRVIYRADNDVLDRVELYSVPIDGGQAVKLNPPLAANRNVLAGLHFTPDGQNVIYLADQESNAVNELFLVPIDGSGPARKVSGPAIGGGIPGSFAGDQFVVDARSKRVVYYAYRANGFFRLMSAPLSGNGSAIELTLPGQNLEAPPFTSLDLRVKDGAAFFRLRRRGEGTSLYRVPAVGGPPPLRLNRPRFRGNDQLDFAPSSGPVVYRSDEEQAGVFELFLHHLEMPPGHTKPR